MTALRRNVHTRDNAQQVLHIDTLSEFDCDSLGLNTAAVSSQMSVDPPGRVVPDFDDPTGLRELLDSATGGSTKLPWQVTLQGQGFVLDQCNTMDCYFGLHVRAEVRLLSESQLSCLPPPLSTMDPQATSLTLPVTLVVNKGRYNQRIFHVGDVTSLPVPTGRLLFHVRVPLAAVHMVAMPLCTRPRGSPLQSQRCGPLRVVDYSPPRRMRLSFAGAVFGCDHWRVHAVQ
jgi:hypothetical protein